jgi:archaemetzincin
MALQSINLITFGSFEEAFLRKIVGTVNHELILPVNIREGRLDLSEFYDPGRRQYDGNKLLRAVDQIYSDDTIKTIGLFNVDLFIPILTFIFGQAFLNGRTGIASVYRLGNERYGIIKDDEVTLERFGKEIIHETGHTFGLIHCHAPVCVMRSSTYAEDIDQKEAAFCPACRSGVRSFLSTGIIGK